jgi:hypothetical protein
MGVTLGLILREEHSLKVFENRGQATCIVEMRDLYKILFGRDHSKDLGMDQRITLKCM